MQFCLAKQGPAVCEPLSTWLNGISPGTAADVSTVILPASQLTQTHTYCNR